jgi:hypothetical protein
MPVYTSLQCHYSQRKPANKFICKKTSLKSARHFALQQLQYIIINIIIYNKEEKNLSFSEAAANQTKNKTMTA